MRNDSKRVNQEGPSKVWQYVLSLSKRGRQVPDEPVHYSGLGRGAKQDSRTEDIQDSEQAI